MIREKTKKSKSNYYVVLMAVMLIGYGLFFTSKLWFPTNTDYIDATSLYKNLKFDTYTLYLTEWNYATSDQAMEITIELQNTEVLDKKLIYTAVERTAGELHIEPVLSDSKYVVLRISDLKPNWEEISLRISTKTDSVLKLYTNKNTVQHVKSLPKRTEKEYRKNRLQFLQQYTEAKIQDGESQIEKLKKKNSQLEQKIAELQQTEHLTADEIEENNTLVSKAESEITGNEDHISELQTDMEKLNDDVVKIKEQINAL